jgi:hypothetical protein
MDSRLLVRAILNGERSAVNGIGHGVRESRAHVAVQWPKTCALFYQESFAPWALIRAAYFDRQPDADIL